MYISEMGSQLLLSIEALETRIPLASKGPLFVELLEGFDRGDLAGYFMPCQIWVGRIGVNTSVTSVLARILPQTERV